MKTLFDLLPLAVFFVAYQLAPHLGYTGKPLLPATAALMAATALILAITYWRDRKIAINPLLTGVVVALFGGLTLALQNDTFIKMKPTIINLLFATILLVGLAFRKSLLKHIFQMAVQLEERGWRLLTFRWGLFFIFLAGLNEIVWRTQTEQFWVNFKVFGMLPLTMLFMACQYPLLKRYQIEA